MHTDILHFHLIEIDFYLKNSLLVRSSRVRFSEMLRSGLMLVSVFLGGQTVTLEN